MIDDPGLALLLRTLEARMKRAAARREPRALVAAPLVETLRALFDETRAPKDSPIARAIAEMAKAPKEAWSLEKLARAVGLSRAVFARRFREATGMAPLAWLAELRLSLAERRLVATDDSLAEIAGAIGYGSEFAFARAFKRRFGVAPGRYRRSHALTTFAVSPIRAAA